MGTRKLCWEETGLIIERFLYGMAGLSGQGTLLVDTDTLFQIPFMEAKVLVVIMWG